MQVKLARLQASLSLYNSLGGGWEQKVLGRDLQEPTRLVAVVSARFY